MRKMFYLFLIISILSCKNAIKNENSEKLYANNEVKLFTEPIRMSESLIVNSKEDLLGFWEFDDNKEINHSYLRGIFIFFKKNEENKVIGELYLYGRVEPVVFDLKEKEDKLYLDFLSDSDKIDYEKLQFEIKKGSSNLKVSSYKMSFQEKESKDGGLNFKKRIFSYNINSVIDKRFRREDDGKTKSYGKRYTVSSDQVLKINPSKFLLKNSEVENLSKTDLYILQNLIYAKHGMAFQNKRLQGYFLTYNWYLPLYENVDKELTDIEKKNIDILSRYEQNAVDYYKVFTR
ncbi:MAG: YARHG domain-containing protein [Limnohabitans sp.]|nr:YARHG domain-containing protein [Limnohabitans sp.]